MKILSPVLGVFFSVLQMIVHILLAPVTLLCGIGLLLFAFKIAADVRRKLVASEGRVVLPPAPEVWHWQSV